MHNTNKQATKQQRVSPQRNQEENKQPLLNLILKRDDATSKDQHFLFKSHNQTDWREKFTSQIII